jgi:hypothetical protein
MVIFVQFFWIFFISKTLLAFSFTKKYVLFFEKKTAIIKPEAKEVHRFVADEITIENHNLETIYKEPGSINGKDVVLSNLKNCTISICDHLGAIRINDVKKNILTCVQKIC